MNRGSSDVWFQDEKCLSAGEGFCAGRTVALIAWDDIEIQLMMAEVDLTNVDDS